MPRSFATAEKLPFSTTRTKICSASNLSTGASVFLYGIDSIQGETILSLAARLKNSGQKMLPPLRHAFLFGIAGIPRSAKPFALLAHQHTRRLNQRSAESAITNHRRSHVGINRKSCTRYRRFGWHLRNDRQKAGLGVGKGGHHLSEG